MIRRRFDRGLVPVYFMIMGMYFAAVFAAGLTDAVHRKHKAQDRVGVVCFPDPRLPEYQTAEVDLLRGGR